MINNNKKIISKKNNIKKKIDPELIKECINYKKNKTIYYLSQSNNIYYKLNKDIIIKKSNFCSVCSNNIKEPCYIFYKNISTIFD